MPEMTHTNFTPEPQGEVTNRQRAAELAWRPLWLIGEGCVEEGLAVFDDNGTWWSIASRSEQPSWQMKALLSEILVLVPMNFELIGSIVEGNRVALMVESHCRIDDHTIYNNAYSFVTEVDLDRDVIVGVREYVDTLHVATVLIPALVRAIEDGGDYPEIRKTLGEP